MTAWVCPSCQRQFGRRNQSHECAPAMTLDVYYSTGPVFERPICEAVISFLRSVGPVHIEPVSVGIFLKRSRSFAELRPMVRWEALSFAAPRRIDDPRIARRMGLWHVVNLRTASDFSTDVEAWLEEAYLASPV
jgi:hypothetical protein